MAFTSVFYSVSIKIYPFEYGGAKEVGCYSTKETAERVARLIRLAFEQQVDGGIDIGIQAYQGEVVRTAMGLRLKETPNGAITLIDETFSETETARILKLLPILLEPALKPTVSIMDRPRCIREGNYHCVTLDFEPFDGSQKLFVGYYQSRQTAQSALDYIMQTHQQKKIGCGFDMNIETYKGKFVQYESGKLYMKISGKDHEVRSSCDGNEFTRISKSVNESIDKWS